MKTTNNKFWLIREIARKTNFTIGDIEIVLSAFEDTIYDIIQNKEDFLYNNLFKITVKETPEHNGWNAVRNEPMIIPLSYRIKFKASRNLLNLVRDSKDSDYDNYSEEE